jgi:hypothetical protein
VALEKISKDLSRESVCPPDHAARVDPHWRTPCTQSRFGFGRPLKVNKRIFQSSPS